MVAFPVSFPVRTEILRMHYSCISLRACEDEYHEQACSAIVLGVSGDFRWLVYPCIICESKRRKARLTGPRCKTMNTTDVMSVLPHAERWRPAETLRSMTSA